MSAGWAEHDTLVDLLSERAIAGLSGSEEARAADMCRTAGVPLGAFDRSVAALDGAYSAAEHDDAEAMPESVRRGLEAAAAAYVAGMGTGRVGARPALRLAGTERDASGAVRSPGLPNWLGWAAAAACLGLAVTAWVSRPTGAGGVGGIAQGAPTDADYRRWMNEVTVAAQAGGSGAISTAWLGIDDAKLAPAAHKFDQDLAGRIVWDAAGQRGWMAFKGLAANDPQKFQYQLWIFDAERPIGELPEFAVDGLPILTQRPVDGGVFDIDPSMVGADGTVVVPIDAKLRVGKAALFAITVEPPGGSVVSKREIVAVAVAG